MRRRVCSLIVTTAALAVAALTLSLGGLAALSDKEQIHLTAADQAFARATVVKKSDLGTVGTLDRRLGEARPRLRATVCVVPAKQSDLVLTGAAETKFKQPGIELDSEAQVLADRADGEARLAAHGDRTGLASVPAHRPREELGPHDDRRLGSSGFVPARQPVRGCDPGAPRRQGGSSTVPLALRRLVFVGHGRTEISLTTTALLLNDTVTRAAEARLALIMAARAAACQLLAGRGSKNGPEALNGRAHDAPTAYTVAVEFDHQDAGPRRVCGVGWEDEIAERPSDNTPSRGGLDAAEDVWVRAEDDLRACTERGRCELTLT